MKSQLMSVYFSDGQEFSRVKKKEEKKTLGS